MDVLMFFRMYEGKMMLVFFKKLKFLINYMNYWVYRFLFYLVYFFDEMWYLFFIVNVK